MALNLPGGRGPGLALGGAVALVAGAAVASPALVVVGSGLLGLVAIAGLLGGLVARSMRLVRHLDPPRCADGDTVAVVAAPRWPAGLRALAAVCDVDLCTSAGTLEGLRRGVDGRRRWRWHMGPLPRGEHRLGALTVVITDPFGMLVWTRCPLPVGPAWLLVEPRSVLPEMVVLADGLAEVASGGGPSARVGELDRVRPYRRGDPLNRIHWGQTAKRGRLQAMELRRGREPWALVEVVVDGAAPTAAGHELAISVAASLMRFCEHRAIAAGLTVGGEMPHRLAPAHHPWPQIAAPLARARPGREPVELPAPGPDGCLVVVGAGPPALWRRRLGALVGQTGLVVVATGPEGPPALGQAGGIAWRRVENFAGIGAGLGGDGRWTDAA